MSLRIVFVKISIYVYSSRLKYDDKYICEKLKYYIVYICFTFQRVLVNTGVHDAKQNVPRTVEEIPVGKRMEIVSVSINNFK